ncbi:MAG: hypothetical protein ACYS1E_11200, partial [Planctomycetota bacterium]
MRIAVLLSEEKVPLGDTRDQRRHALKRRPALTAGDWIAEQSLTAPLGNPRLPVRGYAADGLPL